MLGNKIVEFLIFDVRIADFVTFGAQILELVIVSSCEVESFWDALCLCIQPFCVFTIESCKVAQGHLVVVEN